MKIIMPQLGETVNDGTITIWHKKVGDSVVKDELLLDVETDKATVEVPAPISGVLTEILVAEGDTVDVGVLLAVVTGEGEDEVDSVGEAAVETPPTPAPAKQSDRMTKDAPGKPVVAGKANGKLSPVVRRLIAEHELDVSLIAGTGKRGRITRQDVLNYIEAGTATLAPPPTATLPADLDGRSVIPFDRIRKLTADHMVMSKATSPHVLQAVEVDYTAVDAVRSAVGATWKAERGYSLTYLPFISRAICMAISDFPKVNASIEGDNLRVHSLVNLAIAVDLNFEGLVAPVIRNCGNHTVPVIAESIRTLSQKARSKSLSPDDLAGGTYTISNSGPFGTLLTAPIINQPQVAIISTDGIKKRPVVIESELGDAIAIRPVGILAQSFDHRAFDGAYSAAFLRQVKELLEQHDWSGELQ